MVNIKNILGNVPLPGGSVFQRVREAAVHHQLYAHNSEGDQHDYKSNPLLHFEATLDGLGWIPVVGIVTGVVRFTFGLLTATFGSIGSGIYNKSLIAARDVAILGGKHMLIGLREVIPFRLGNIIALAVLSLYHRENGFKHLWNPRADEGSRPTFYFNSTTLWSPCSPAPAAPSQDHVGGGGRGGGGGGGLERRLEFSGVAVVGPAHTSFPASGPEQQKVEKTIEGKKAVFSHSPGTHVWILDVEGEEPFEIEGGMLRKSDRGLDPTFKDALVELGYIWREEPAQAPADLPPAEAAVVAPAPAAAAAAAPAAAADKITAALLAKNPDDEDFLADAAAIWEAREARSFEGKPILNLDQIERMRVLERHLCRATDQTGQPKVYPAQIARVMNIESSSDLPAFANATLFAAHRALQKENTPANRLRLKGIMGELQKRTAEARGAAAQQPRAADAAAAAAGDGASQGKRDGVGNGPSAGERRLADPRKDRPRRPGRVRP